MSDLFTTNAPHWFGALCLGLVVVAYLGVAVISRVALYRLTRSRRRSARPALISPHREEVRS